MSGIRNHNFSGDRQIVYDQNHDDPYINLLITYKIM